MRRETGCTVDSSRRTVSIAQILIKRLQLLQTCSFSTHPTATRVDIEAESTSKTTADILGISAVIVNDLKQRRQRDYVFDWDKTLQMSGDTGIRLQYTHCRLCSLAHTFAAQMPDEHDERRRPRVSMLREPQAEQLLLEIARFEDVLARSEESLEACVLVVYLFGLW